MTGDTPPPRWLARLQAGGDAVIPLEPVRSVAPAAPGVPTGAPRMPAKSGILNIDKPAGRTSHDVVQAVRRASGERRVGHAGTLDPAATGVLVVCLGAATRVIEDIQALPKSYRARVRLGVRTDSGDADGAAIATRDPSGVARATVETALEAFRGGILQTPPMVSALKHEGRRLYELARLGIEVERAPRPVTVYALELTEWAPPELTLECRVSKGTYIRTLADDLGERLGVGAHVTALTRTAIGPFTLADAERLARVVEAFVEGFWPTLLHPLDAALAHLDALVVEEADAAALRHGRQIAGPAPEKATTGQVRVYDATGGFVGLVAWDEATERWQPTRVFPKAP